MRNGETRSGALSQQKQDAEPTSAAFIVFSISGRVMQHKHDEGLTCRKCRTELAGLHTRTWAEKAQNQTAFFLHASLPRLLHTASRWKSFLSPHPSQSPLPIRTHTHTHRHNRRDVTEDHRETRSVPQRAVTCYLPLRALRVTLHYVSLWGDRFTPALIKVMVALTKGQLLNEEGGRIWENKELKHLLRCRIRSALPRKSWSLLTDPPSSSLWPCRCVCEREKKRERERERACVCVFWMPS